MVKKLLLILLHVPCQQNSSLKFHFLNTVVIHNRRDNLIVYQLWYNRKYNDNRPKLKLGKFSLPTLHSHVTFAITNIKVQIHFISACPLNQCSSVRSPNTTELCKQLKETIRTPGDIDHILYAELLSLE